MNAGTKYQGLKRRMFRAFVKWRRRTNRVSRLPGKCVLWGYGHSVRYPDQLIWINQFLHIFCRDCYNAGTLRGAPVVVDGGANIGVFACWVKWLNPQARVTAIEPCPQNVEYLRSNICGLPSPAVTVVEAAITRDANQPVRMGGSCSDSMRSGCDSGDIANAVSLASVIGDHVDLLKLDIEGGELDALLSAGEALKRVRRVVLEYHRYRDQSVNLSEVVGALEEQGFDRFRLRDHCDFEWTDPQLPQYCCLLEADRSASH